MIVSIYDIDIWYKYGGLINNRYSVRKFSKEEIELEKINNILEGAMTAPSSKNKFNLPQYILPVSLVALGYKDNVENKIRIIDKSKIHYNGWENL